MSKYLLLIIVILAPTLFNAATASFFDTLVMPGKLIVGHAKLEKDCDNCHRSFDKGEQSGLCLECHDEVREDVNNKLGFHGKSSNVSNNNCKHCHTDHDGRDKNIVLIDIESFSHKLTDFELKDRHLATPCISCHVDTKLYRDTKASCIDCHREDSSHSDDEFDQCQECHNGKKWIEIEFNHDATDFPLQGKHDDTECNSCHIGGKLNGADTECNSCHAINDVHNGSFGEKCDSCHGNDRWEDSNFNHDTETEFSLSGAHKLANCKSCHKENSATKKIRKNCISCHSSDDDHSGRFGLRCSSCHSSISWKKSRFNHNKADFKLLGKHQKVSCNSCHINSDPADTPGKCISCHLSDDRHQGELGKQCLNCHNETGWQEKVRFDHDLSSFPLIGQHVVAPCEQCHLSLSFSESPSTCNECHTDVDEHDGAFGKDCQSCHNPNSWGAWEFNHEDDTNFPLRLGHRKVSCTNCHNTTQNKSKGVRNCVICHQADDIHNGRFGRRCGRCHEESSFREIVVH